MKIIISPAKKMNQDTDFPASPGTPVFLEQAAVLMETVRRVSLSEAKAVWKWSHKLAGVN